MLRPDDLEALLAVCMVQPGFEVFAYCSKCCFLARRNLGLESFKDRLPSSIPKCAPVHCRSGLQKVRPARDCHTMATSGMATAVSSSRPRSCSTRCTPRWRTVPRGSWVKRLAQLDVLLID